MNTQSLIELGKALFQNGQYPEAQLKFAEAVLAESGNAEHKALFVQSLTGRPFPRYDETIKQAIMFCFAENTLRHLPLFFSWHALLLHAPETAILARIEACETYEDMRTLLAEAQDSYSPLLNSAFLQQGLKKLLIKNYAFERVLTGLRRYVLLEASPKECAKHKPFLSALATQCFFNEYLFYVTAEEQAKLDHLRHKLTETADETEILLYACYRPLWDAPDAQSLLTRFSGDACSADMVELLQIQIEDPLEERRLKDTIKPFGAISDQTSQAVQAQYEEHPFPRWVACGHTRSGEKAKLSAGRKILIAGCGTGQQAVTAAMNFPLAELTAIDLSKASLAYAHRKAEEYGQTNITFRHGDILDVASLGERFDYIVCGGVLHHMKVPEDGFRALKGVLKPDGIMRIALYSEIARRQIVAVQNWIMEQGFPPTSEGIRDFRKRFMEGGYRDIFTANTAIPYFDCFSVSETRDLFFHVQEHRFTCPALKDILSSLALDLLVFAPEAYGLHQRYRQLFPDDPHATNLDNWHIIEQNNPGLFIGMYKFYTAPKGQHAPGAIPAWLAMG